jgi:hypothetical protein
MSKIVIDLAAEFTGKKAFKQADSATARLNKSVRNLAGAFGLAFSTRAVVNYSKAAIQAFAADDKAAKVLSRTLTNLGLAFADPEVKNFISTLEKQYGVLDDKLRPAYQKLVTTTGDYKKSQNLLKTALDLSALSGEDVVSVADDLARAFVGNTKGLQKYGLGLNKAQLAAMSFEEILRKIAIVSNGQAALAADTYSGKLDKLSVAASNAQEVLGGALLDAVIKLGGGDIDKTTNKIDQLSQAFAQLIRLATGTSAMSLQQIFDQVDFKYGFIPVNKVKSPRSKSPAGTFKNQQAAKKAREEALKQEKLMAKLAKDQAAAALAIVKSKKLAAAIDKANLLLGKATDVFDIDKIQIAAALTNQAELLGKATEGSQILQIANDTARLNVKRDILDLEAAIASKDEAAIIAATEKLNKDLGILNALTNQKTQMVAIESILKDLAPKDLIDQKNLDEALKKIKEMLGLLDKFDPKKLFNQSDNAISATTAPRTAAEINAATAALGGIVSVIGANGKEFTKLVNGQAPAFQTVQDVGSFNALVKSFANGAINPFNAGSFRTAEGGGLFNSGAVGARDINITIQANTIANPDELTNLIQDSLIRLNRRGDALTQAGSL